jgi:superoxide reductase
MSELIPGTVDASLEKHVPVISVNGNTVTVNVGAAAHPMTEEHFIQWVYLQTVHGGQRKCLKPGDAPTRRSP